MNGYGGDRLSNGKGGLDVTRHLTLLRDDVSKKWDTLGKKGQNEMLELLYSFNPINDVMITRAWDIDEFFKHKKGKFAGPKSEGFCPNTVTVNNRVYYAEEVNYFLWGIVNRLAYDSSVRLLDTNRFSTLYIIYEYRFALYPHTIGSGATIGRMAWACAGWDAGRNNEIIYPDYVSLPYATANNQNYSGSISYNAGDAPKGRGVSGWVK